MNTNDLSNIKKIYKEFNIDKLQLTTTSILFTVACAANFKWLKFNDNILPLKRYFHGNFIKNADFILHIVQVSVFPLLNILIPTWFVFVILAHFLRFTNFNELKNYIGTINLFIINEIWLSWFLFKSLFFQDFKVPYKLSNIVQHLPNALLNTNCYLFYLLCLTTILNYIFAPINFKIYKARKRKSEFEHFLKEK